MRFPEADLALKDSGVGSAPGTDGRAAVPGLCAPPQGPFLLGAPLRRHCPRVLSPGL